MLLLAGDIGGTHARLALMERGDSGFQFLERRTFESNAYEDLVPIVRRFLDRLDVRPEAGCLAVACPIVEGICNPANLPWSIELASFGERIGLPGARIINDFDAVGYAIPELGPSDLRTIKPGTADEGAPIGVIGAGTGLGVAFLLPDEGGCRVLSSEGGHIGFAPRTEMEVELWRFLREQYREASGGRVSYERVLSGAGLVAVYEFLVLSGRAQEDPLTRGAMEREDPAAVISRRGLAGDDPAARSALGFMASVYGAAAGDFALTLQTAGGVYIAGGVARHNVDALEGETFVQAFLDKGRLRGALEEVPVHVVLHPDVGLVGAAAAADRSRPGLQPRARPL